MRDDERTSVWRIRSGTVRDVPIIFDLRANGAAIRFYKRMGARLRNEWILTRLTAPRCAASPAGK